MDIGVSAGLNAEPTSSDHFRQVNYFVDGAFGNDQGDGTINNPFRTIQRAIDAADDSNNPGANNILINPGVYYENLSISDNDLVKLIGRTNDPYDVEIRGGFDFNISNAESEIYTIDIDGGNAVVLANMRVTDGYEGINAYGLQHLKLYNVVADNNYDDGLDAEEVYKVSVYHSKLYDNGDDGADISYAEEIWIGYSDFNDNSDEGIELYENGNASLYHVTASNNRDDGLESNYLGHLHIEKSYFIGNDDDGADLVETDYIRAYDSQFGFNGENGVEMYYNGDVQFYKVRAFENGRFADGGGGEGPRIVGGDSEFELGNGVAAFETDYFKIQYGTFSDNFNDGVFLQYTNHVEMRDTYMARNVDDGANLVIFGDAKIYGGYFSENYGNGVQFAAVFMSDLEQVSLTGLEGNGEQNGGEEYARNVYIYGGKFAENYDNGMRMNGLNHLYVQASTVYRNEDDGVRITNSEYTEFKYLLAKNNYDDGLELDDIGEVHAKYVTAIENGSEFQETAAQQAFAAGDLGDDAGESGGTNDGINVDDIGSLYIYGGRYNDNFDDGIRAGDVDYAELKYVRAERNGTDGVDIGDGNIIHVTGGYYLDNDDDGLELNGRDSTVKYVIAKRNGEDGLDFDSQSDNDTAVVYGGVFAENAFDPDGESAQGIDASGIEYLYVTHAKVLDNNNEGLRATGVIDAEIKYGKFAHNGGDGIFIRGRFDFPNPLAEGDPNGGQEPFGEVLIYKPWVLDNNGNGVFAEALGFFEVEGGNYSFNNGWGILGFDIVEFAIFDAIFDGNEFGDFDIGLFNI